MEIKEILDKIICGDCLTILRQLPDKCVDLILTDPPYNVSTDNVIKRNGGKFGHAKDIKLDFGWWDRGVVRPFDYLDEFVRVLKPYGVLVMFYDRLYLGQIGLYLQECHGFQTRHIGAWVKTNPAPQARKVKWQIGTEMFIVTTKNRGSGHHFNYKIGQSPDYFVSSVNYRHEHPTQKPLELIKWIVSYWSFEGDIVLDPFIGSGTTAVASKKLNRHFIGIDINPDYCEIARKRLAELPESLDKFT